VSGGQISEALSLWVLRQKEQALGIANVKLLQRFKKLFVILMRRRRRQLLLPLLLRQAILPPGHACGQEAEQPPHRTQERFFRSRRHSFSL
jgi:hypothetical protein